MKKTTPDINPLIEFNPKLPKLSKNESEVLNLLKEAGKLVIPLYKLQENRKFPGANFYPHDVTKKEIEVAAKKDPQILSPYTIVERINHRLTATPYHIKYADLLKPISDKLLEAAEKCENEEFKKALKLQASSLLSGTYEQAFVNWIKTKPYILDISIGPNDYFDDQLFSVKMSYQTWVGVLDKEMTEKTTLYKDMILSARRRAIMSAERIESNGNNVRIKVLDVILFSGLMARTSFVGLNHPTDLNIVKKSGTEIILFKQANDLRVKQQIIPTFNKLFSLIFKKGFKEEDLRQGELSYVTLHELAHSYLRYKNAINLQDLLPCIEELAATTLGIRVGGSLLLKDSITTRQMESMIIAFICRSMYLLKSMKEEKPMLNYALGGMIFINFMLENNALKQHKGLAIANFTKIFIALHELSSILEEFLSQGNRKEAESFIKKYSGFPKFL